MPPMGLEREDSLINRFAKEVAKEEAWGEIHKMAEGAMNEFQAVQTSIESFAQKRCPSMAVESSVRGVFVLKLDVLSPSPDRLVISLAPVMVDGSYRLMAVGEQNERYPLTKGAEGFYELATLSADRKTSLLGPEYCFSKKKLWVPTIGWRAEGIAVDTDWFKNPRQRLMRREEARLGVIRHHKPRARIEGAVFFLGPLGEELQHTLSRTERQATGELPPVFWFERWQIKKDITNTSAFLQTLQGTLEGILLPKAPLDKEVRT